MSNLNLSNFTGADERWSQAFCVAIVALLTFMPLAFGAVEAWSELVVVCVAGVLTLGLTVRSMMDTSFRLVATWAYLPLFLFLLLIAFQLFPLPTWLVEAISPPTAAIRNELLASEWTNQESKTGPPTAAAGDPTMPISLYPHATEHGLRLVLVGTAVFVVVVNTLRNREQILQLLTAIFVIGCAEAMLSLLQIATLSTKIYWSIVDMGRVVTAGGFVNHSHFSQFINLSLGAGLALLLIRLHRERHEGSRRVGRLHSMDSVSWDKHGWILCGLILCAISVLTSMSRNGVISLCIAVTAVAAALYLRGSIGTRGWMLVAVPFAVLIGLLTFGFDLVYDRIATLEDTQHWSVRMEMATGTLRAWLAYPIWGTGLGTHEFVFPGFDPSAIVSVAAHADNDYAQLLEEMGVVGAALVAAFLTMIALTVVKLMRKGRTSLSIAAYGLAYGLVAVAIHSLSDFGQHIPAVFSLSAISCALLVSIARYESSVTTRKGRKSASHKKGNTVFQGRGRAGIVVTLIGLVFIWAWAIRGAYASYLGEYWRTVALGVEDYLQGQEFGGEDQDFIDLIAASEQVCEWSPDNVKYGYWLNLYRWQAISRDVDADTGQTLLHPDVLPIARRICDELAQVRTLCPLYGSPYALEGQIRLFVLEEERGANLIRLGYRLSPNDPPTCLVAGELAARNHDAELAVAALTRAVKLMPGYFREVAQIIVSQLDRPDLAQQLAGENHAQLRQLADILTDDERYSKLAVEVTVEAEDSLRKAIESDAATPEEMVAVARLETQNGDMESAVELYRRALGLRYTQIDWRLSLAQLLAEMDNVYEARREARLCLRLRPDHVGARRLLEELSLRSE